MVRGNAKVALAVISGGRETLASKSDQTDGEILMFSEWRFIVPEYVIGVSVIAAVACFGAPFRLRRWAAVSAECHSRYRHNEQKLTT